MPLCMLVFNIRSSLPFCLVPTVLYLYSPSPLSSDFLRSIASVLLQEGFSTPTRKRSSLCCEAVLTWFCTSIYTCSFNLCQRLYLFSPPWPMSFLRTHQAWGTTPRKCSKILKLHLYYAPSSGLTVLAVIKYSHPTPKKEKKTNRGKGDILIQCLPARSTTTLRKHCSDIYKWGDRSQGREVTSAMTKPLEILSFASPYPMGLSRM